MTAAETGAAEGVERMVPLGREMDIAIRYCIVGRFEFRCA